MNIITTIQLQVNRELAALRRANVPDYAIRSEAIRNFETRLGNYFIKHPEELQGTFGPELELPPSKFNDVMDLCAAALAYDDDTRFSLYDLMDAVGHPPDGIDLNINRLLKLSEEDAYQVLMSMADAKRRTYCDGFEANPDAYPTADGLDDLVQRFGLDRKRGKS